MKTNEEIEALKIQLETALNNAVIGPSIYIEQRFADVKLRPETQELLQQNPQGNDLTRLNRLLLDDTYSPQEAPDEAVLWRRNKLNLPFSNLAGLVLFCIAAFLNRPARNQGGEHDMPSRRR